MLKEDIWLNLTPGDYFYQLFVYIYEIYLAHCYSIDLVFLAATVSLGKCFYDLLFLLL